MKRINFIELFIIAIMVLFAPHKVFGQYNLVADVISCSASVSNSSGFNLTGTIGQPITENANNSDFQLYSGFWFAADIITDIDEDSFLPNEYKLFNNYPNPFNPSTTIKYQLKKRGNVTLILYNSLGKRIRTLVNDNKEAGVYSVNFNASNISSGVYFYRLISEKFVETKRMILLK